MRWMVTARIVGPSAHAVHQSEFIGVALHNTCIVNSMAMLSMLYRPSLPRPATSIRYLGKTRTELHDDRIRSYLHSCNLSSVRFQL